MPLGFKNSSITATLTKKTNRRWIDRSKSPVRFNGAVEVAANGEKMYTRRRIYACANARVGRSHTKPSIKARCAFDISVITGVVPRCHEHRCSRVDLFYRFRRRRRTPSLCQNRPLHVRVSTRTRESSIRILIATRWRQDDHR